MASLFITRTQQESGVIVTRGTKLVAFLWTNTLHVSLCTSTWFLCRTDGTGLNIGRKAAVFSEGDCHLEPIQCVHGCAMGGLRYKGFEPLFSKEKKLSSCGSPQCFNEMVLFEDLLYKLKLIEWINWWTKWSSLCIIGPLFVLPHLCSLLALLLHSRYWLFFFFFSSILYHAPSCLRTFICLFSLLGILFPSLQPSFSFVVNFYYLSFRYQLTSPCFKKALC